MNTPAAYWYQIDKGHQVDKVERLDQWDFVFSPWHFGTKILLMAVLSITMHGCTRLQIPLLQRDVPATWHHISHSQHAVSVPQPDLKNWWRAFADQELEKIVINALRSNLDLQQSVGRIRAARALGQYTSNKLKPSLTFRTDSTPYPGVDTSYFVAGFDATWELGIFGSHNSEILGALSKLNLALAETQAARVSVVAEVVRTYIKLRNTQQKLVLLNNLARTKKILLTLVRIRQTLGFASMVDVSRSEGGYTESLVSISQIREIEEKSLQQLAVLLGYTEPDPRDDLSGLDVARKLTILARELGHDIEVGSFPVENLIPEGLRDVDATEFMASLSDYDAQMETLFAAASAAGKVLRYVATLNADGEASVALQMISTDNAMAHINLTDNIVQFTTQRYADNPLVFQGPGAGPAVTAGGIFADVLNLANFLEGTD